MKNVKKIRQLTMRLKMQWKILIGVLVSGVACGGVLIFANADSSVSLSLTPAQSSVIQGSTSTVIHANLQVRMMNFMTRAILRTMVLQVL